MYWRISTALQWAVCTAVLFTASARAELPLPPAQTDFTLTAGNAFFDQTPALGAICTFDFGDPAGAYNHLTGFNAAHIYQTPGDYTMTLSRVGEPIAVKKIHVVPDKRGVQSVAAGESLADAIRGAPNDSIVLLQPGVTYDLVTTAEIRSRNVEFRAAGPGAPPRIRRIVGTKASNSIIVHGLNIVFRGIEFDSDREMKTVGNAKVNIKALTADTAHIVLDHCTFRNVDDAVFCTPLTRGLLVQGCHFTDEVRSCDIWIGGADLSLLGNTMETSQHEHNCRSSDKGFYNILVYDNEMHATHRKETLTFREGQDLYAAHNAFYGWLRMGPGPRGDKRPMTPEELQKSFVRSVVIEGNAFLGPWAWIQINEGTSNAIVRGNRIDVEPTAIAVTAQGPSLHDIRLEDNYRVIRSGENPKPLLRQWSTNPGDVTEHGSGTKTAEEAEKLKGK